MILILVTFLLAAVAHGQECTLNCPADAPCVLGDGGLSEHRHVFPHLEDSQSEGHNNMHCACPPGWTGILCDRRFESCSNDHTCYHGGKCISGLLDEYGNDQLFCDCSGAIYDGVRHVGKYCETPSQKYCQNVEGSHGEQLFCVNGGDCNPNYQ